MCQHSTTVEELATDRRTFHQDWQRGEKWALFNSISTCQGSRWRRLTLFATRTILQTLLQDTTLKHVSAWLWRVARYTKALSILRLRDMSGFEPCYSEKPTRGFLHDSTTIFTIQDLDFYSCSLFSENMNNSEHMRCDGSNFPRQILFVKNIFYRSKVK